MHNSIRRERVNNLYLSKWHRYNPFSKNHRDLYLNQLGNPVGRNSEPSHIDPNCK